MRKQPREIEAMSKSTLLSLQEAEEGSREKGRLHRVRVYGAPRDTELPIPNSPQCKSSCECLSSRTCTAFEPALRWVVFRDVSGEFHSLSHSTSSRPSMSIKNRTEPRAMRETGHWGEMSRPRGDGDGRPPGEPGVGRKWRGSRGRARAGGRAQRHHRWVSDTGEKGVGWGGDRSLAEEGFQPGEGSRRSQHSVCRKHPVWSRVRGRSGSEKTGVRVGPAPASCPGLGPGALSTGAQGPTGEGRSQAARASRPFSGVIVRVWVCSGSRLGTGKAPRST